FKAYFDDTIDCNFVEVIAEDFSSGGAACSRRHGMPQPRRPPPPFLRRRSFPPPVARRPRPPPPPCRLGRPLPELPPPPQLPLHQLLGLGPAPRREPRLVALRRGPTGLGFNIVGGENGEGIFVSFILTGGPADASGRAGAEGRRRLRPAAVAYRPEDYNHSPVSRLESRTSRADAHGEQRRLRTTQKRSLYVRALFDYDPLKDTGLPNRGVAFQQGDILHVTNASDDECGSPPGGLRCQRRRPPTAAEQATAFGIIPSKRRQSQQQPAAPSEDAASAGNLSDSHVAIPTYEAVQQLDIRLARPVIILGPLKDQLNDALIGQFPDRFGSCREGEQDGRDYHFVDSREQMERDIAEHLFIEAGQYNGNLYGTSVSSVRRVAQSGRHCILDVSGNAIRRLEAAGLPPIAIFVRAASMENLCQLRRGLTEEQARKLLDRSARMEAEFSAYFTATVSGQSFDEIFSQVKRVISAQSDRPVWVTCRDEDVCGGICRRRPRSHRRVPGNADDGGGLLLLVGPQAGLQLPVMALHTNNSPCSVPAAANWPSGLKQQPVWSRPMWNPSARRSCSSSRERRSSTHSWLSRVAASNFIVEADLLVEVAADDEVVEGPHPLVGVAPHADCVVAGRRGQQLILRVEADAVDAGVAAGEAAAQLEAAAADGPELHLAVRAGRGQQPAGGRPADAVHFAVVCRVHGGVQATRQADDATAAAAVAGRVAAGSVEVDVHRLAGGLLQLTTDSLLRGRGRGKKKLMPTDTLGCISRALDQVGVFVRQPLHAGLHLVVRQLVGLQLVCQSLVGVPQLLNFRAEPLNLVLQLGGPALGSEQLGVPRLQLPSAPQHCVADFEPVRSRLPLLVGVALALCLAAGVLLSEPPVRDAHRSRRPD
uniref:Guanylate kinase-like domain-containing protein n=1 Tax=Macrostomum lignano TaxID=282301 RepID=A0A1I8IMB3_9PLAT